MMDEREFLLNELMEHTIDCDCARSQHFFDEAKFRKKSRVFKATQSTVFLLTIATYVLIVSGMQDCEWIKNLSIILTLCSTMLEVCSYMFQYDNEAMDHWKSAQMYAELYRECQFFCSDHSKSSLDVWRVKLNNISGELSRISSLSPSASSESYKQWAEYGYEKQYPVHQAIRNLKESSIDDIINIIKEKLKNYKIEIYLFGSYFTSMHYNDIDIAVILHEDENTIPLKQYMIQIEKDYSVNGLNLDITVISEMDIIANRCTQFIKNICEGKCYYKTPEVKKSIKEKFAGSLINYSEMVTYFQEQAEKTKENYRLFSSNAFYMYYHALTALLAHWGITWYGEKSMIMECEKLSVVNEKMAEIKMTGEEFLSMLSHVRLFMDEKDTAYLNNGINETNQSALINIYQNDKPFIRKIIDVTES